MGTLSVKKAAIKKANEASVKARQLKKEQERREKDTAQKTIPANQFLNTEFGNPDELSSQVEDREVEPVREIAVANEEMENDRAMEPVKDNAYISGPRCSKRLCPRVIGESPPKRKRGGIRKFESRNATKKKNETK